MLALSEKGVGGMSGMTTRIAVEGMADGATLLKQCKSEQRPLLYLDYGKGRCIRLPYALGKELSESPLLTPCEPGLFDGHAQSWLAQAWVIKQAKPKHGA